MISERRDFKVLPNGDVSQLLENMHLKCQFNTVSIFS